MKAISLLTLILIILTISCRQNSSKSVSDSVQRQENFEKRETDSINFQQKVKNANQLFKISDTSAILILKKIKEIQEIVESKYDDTTIKNDLIITDYPTDKAPVWKIELCQFQPRIDKFYTLIFISLNANTGQIKITDNLLNSEEELTLNGWRELKRKK